MTPQYCPICHQPAVFKLSAGNDYEMSCPKCGIKVEITQAAAVMEPPNPENVLEYIKEEKVDPKPVTSDDMVR
jgi:uncharacterized Zn finger protein (UPF0148 family)